MADLYIRWSHSNPTDIGNRPITPCWPPNAVWTNASIWMSYPPNHPDPAKRNMTAPTAQLGEEVLINVQAYSRAAHFPFLPAEPFNPVKCQIWACTGTNGVGPVSSLPSTLGAAGLESLVLGDIDVPDFYGVASVLWTPDAADGLAFDANGAAHICLAANLFYRSAGPATPASQGQRLPQFVPGGPQVSTIFPCGDGPIDPLSGVPIGHFQGQKNIQVLSTSSNLLIPIMIFAGTGGGGMHVLALSERVDRALADAIVREQLLAHATIDLRGGRARRQRTRRLTPKQLTAAAVTVDERLLAMGALPLEPKERARLAGGGELVLADRPRIRLQAATRPLADAAIEGDAGRGQRIEVPADDKHPTRIVVNLRGAEADPPGTVRVFDVAERDGSRRLIGGTTFVTVALA